MPQIQERQEKNWHYEQIRRITKSTFRLYGHFRRWRICDMAANKRIPTKDMRQKKYNGTFISMEGHTYEIEESAFSFFEAFFLLTASAIKSGRHYQLYSIQCENDLRIVGDIMECSKLFV